MRKLTFLFFISLSTLLYSQDKFLNFKIFNDRIIWQKSYETSFSTQEVIDYFKIFGNISIAEQTESRIIGSSSGNKIDFNKYKGSKIGNTIFDDDLAYKVIIDLKDKKYRVTILDIQFTKGGGIMIDGWGNTGNRSSIIDNKYIKDSKFKSSFSREGSESLDKFFIDKFSVKKLLGIF